MSTHSINNYLYAIIDCIVHVSEVKICSHYKFQFNWNFLVEVCRAILSIALVFWRKPVNGTSLPRSSALMRVDIKEWASEQSLL